MHPLIYVPTRSLVVPDRAPRRLGCGTGCGVGGSPSPWNPAAVPNCILYGGGYVESRAVRALQPTLYTAAADYTPSNAAIVLTDDADVPAGLSGTSIKATCADAVSRWGSRAAALIIGNRYEGSCWLKSGGAAIIKMTDGTTAPIFGSSTSVAWALVTGDGTAGSATLLLHRNASAAAGIALFRPISLVNLSLQSYTPQYTTIPGSVLAQASATAQPWVSSDGLGIRYQSDYLLWSAAASNLKCLHDGSGGTLIFAVRPSAFPAAQSHCVSTITTLTPGAGVIGASVYYTNDNRVGVYIANGGGTFDVNVPVAQTISAGTTYVFALRVASGANGVTMRVNGANKVTATLTAPSAADPQSSLRIGTYGGSFAVDGVLGHPFVANRVLTDAECTQVENYILAQATL